MGEKKGEGGKREEIKTKMETGEGKQEVKGYEKKGREQRKRKREMGKKGR